MSVCHRLTRLAFASKLGGKCRCFRKCQRPISSKIATPELLKNERRCCKLYYSTESAAHKRPVVQNTMDEEELANFAKLAASWWDETGEFEALHAMNKLRIPFIRDALLNQRDDCPETRSLPLDGMKICDAGSGGGLLAEPLARLGAFVIGVDPVEESSKIAQLHLEQDPAILPRIKYITGSVEDLVGTEAEMFDAVVSSEVIEHVSDVKTFVESCCKLVKPGGSFFITTLNKTQLARATAVFAAENILRIVPQGTHDWEKFIPPEDLQYIIDNAGLSTRVIHGILYNPLTREWQWIKDTSVNYALHAVKPDTDSSDSTYTPDSESAPS